MRAIGLHVCAVRYQRRGMQFDGGFPAIKPRKILY